MRWCTDARRRTMPSVSSRLPFSHTMISNGTPTRSAARSISGRASSTVPASSCTGTITDNPIGSGSGFVLLVVNVIALMVGLHAEAEVGARQVGALSVVVDEDVSLATPGRRHAFVDAPRVEQHNRAARSDHFHVAQKPRPQLLVGEIRRMLLT